jgi:hypothetical protein
MCCYRQLPASGSRSLSIFERFLSTMSQNLEKIALKHVLNVSDD